jgi:hypothetical protein
MLCTFVTIPMSLTMVQPMAVENLYVAKQQSILELSLPNIAMKSTKINSGIRSIICFIRTLWHQIGGIF